MHERAQILSIYTEGNILFLCSVSPDFSPFIIIFLKFSIFSPKSAIIISWFYNQRKEIFCLNFCYHWNSKIHYPQINVLMFYYIIVLPDLVQLSRPYVIQESMPWPSCLNASLVFDLNDWWICLHWNSLEFSTESVEGMSRICWVLFLRITDSLWVNLITCDFSFRASWIFAMDKQRMEDKGHSGSDAFMSFSL